MKIDVDLEDLVSCEKCHIVVELCHSMMIEKIPMEKYPEFKNLSWKCPCCKQENKIYVEA